MPCRIGYTILPEVHGHPNFQNYVIDEHVLLKTWASVCCANSLHSSGFSLSTRCWTCCWEPEHYWGQHWDEVARWLRARSYHPTFKVLDGVEDRSLCRPVKFFHTKLKKTLKQEKPFPKIGSTLLLKILLHAVALRFLEQPRKNRPRRKKNVCGHLHTFGSIVCLTFYSFIKLYLSKWSIQKIMNNIQLVETLLWHLTPPSSCPPSFF